ncbi:hypothetical protein QBC38DRAFT_531966 [Podospora fimiseda]|uniref:MYND-type domain-containing protein n=1 Tax=Podospora fimiseda TaxID=252190 RepID=A0AAN7BKH6_9PEZI|nr:hypothetical protein QBC38DRAFT_531966 [Podospora fimiseda]
MMKRWGDRLLEAEFDLDLVAGFDAKFKKEQDQLPFSKIFKKDTTKELLNEIRTKLDAGLGMRYFDKIRNQQTNPKYVKSLAMYETVLLGVVFMHVGAKIRSSDLSHLEGLVPQVEMSDGISIIDFTNGWREAGKIQFTVALREYKNGVPRNMLEPSCHVCGFTKTDIMFAPDLCGRCRRAAYCSSNCQKKAWPTHKLLCGFSGV